MGVKYNKRSITINGIKYESLKDAADALGTTSIQLSKKLRKLRDTKYYDGDGYTILPGRHGNAYGYIVLGIYYNTFREACLDYGISETAVRKRMKEHGFNLEQALIYNGRKVTYNGVAYNNLRELCNEINVDYNLVKARTSKNMSIEDAIYDVRHNCVKNAAKSLFIFGEYYNNYREISRVFGLSHIIIVNRINSGWDMDASVSYASSKSERQ